jgi:hypothetical protein
MNGGEASCCAEGSLFISLSSRLDVSACAASAPAGNIKATTPIAFTVALLSWSLMSFPQGFREAKQSQSALDSIRWGADYLTKVHRADPAKNSSFLVTRVSEGSEPAPEPVAFIH